MSINFRIKSPEKKLDGVCVCVVKISETILNLFYTQICKLELECISISDVATRNDN